MSTIASPVSSAGTSTQAGSSSASATTDPLASESTFLTLLVSQLQNQDPLDPVDSNQFVTQLTQYSQLEQLLGIHTDTTAISQAVTTNSTTATSAASDSTTTGAASQTNSATGATN
jgi:flagellar basal-body rod modification protein FlgD